MLFAYSPSDREVKVAERWIVPHKFFDIHTEIHSFTGFRLPAKCFFLRQNAETAVFAREPCSSSECKETRQSTEMVALKVHKGPLSEYYKDIIQHCDNYISILADVA